MPGKKTGLGLIGITVLVLVATVRPAEAAFYDGQTVNMSDTVDFDDGFGGFLLDASVEYAVYEPGDFATAFPGQDPSGGSRWVYAYKILNEGPNLNFFSVGLDGDEPVFDIGFLDGADIDPSPAPHFVPDTPLNPGPTSAVFDFQSPFLTNGDNSDILIFTSTHSPELDSATLAGGFAVDAQVGTPSTMPEPSTLAVLGLGLTLVWARGRRQKAQR